MPQKKSASDIIQKGDRAYSLAKDGGNVGTNSLRKRSRARGNSSNANCNHSPLLRPQERRVGCQKAKARYNPKTNVLKHLSDILSFSSAS
jgi:hypothetical protein